MFDAFYRTDILKYSLALTFICGTHVTTINSNETLFTDEEHTFTYSFVKLMGLQISVA